MVADKLGDRMKENYENRSKTYLTRRTPVIIRIDGCHFHAFTKDLVPIQQNMNFVNTKKTQEHQT